MAATFCEVWEGVTSLIAEVDVLAGFAELATSAPVAYVRPNMLPSDAGEISLIGCRCAILTPQLLAHLWVPTTRLRLHVAKNGGCLDRFALLESKAISRGGCAARTQSHWNTIYI